VDAAWDCGIRYFDTAPHYGLGLSERRLGAALSRHPREDFVISTKVGRLLVENPAPTGSDLANGFAVTDTLTRQLDYSADGVRRSLDASLDRLGLDRVDIVLVHDPDEHVDQAVAEAIPALCALRDAGVIGAVGVGMNQWQAPLEILARSDLDVVMPAGRWTVLDRSGEPLLEACAERGVSVLAAAPFNSGLLSRPVPAPGAPYDYEPAPEPVLARARELGATLAGLGVELPRAALQFPLRHRATASVVTGFRSAAEVTAALARLAEPVPDEVWTKLDGHRMGTVTG
jgi:D-threo-aldose 1-dehydrogenase